jgi:hypothetical protein
MMNCEIHCELEFFSGHRPYIHMNTYHLLHGADGIETTRSLLVLLAGAKRNLIGRLVVAWSLAKCADAFIYVEILVILPF